MTWTLWDAALNAVMFVVAIGAAIALWCVVAGKMTYSPLSQKIFVWAVGTAILAAAGVGSFLDLAEGNGLTVGGRIRTAAGIIGLLGLSLTALKVQWEYHQSCKRFEERMAKHRSFRRPAFAGVR